MQVCVMLDIRWSVDHAESVLQVPSKTRLEANRVMNALQEATPTRRDRQSAQTVHLELLRKHLVPMNVSSVLEL